jgi:DNA helicase HerA-like ATPase
MYVLGRDGGDGPAARLGRFRARDGSAGAAVGVDTDRPHAALVVGKRGTGKSHTLGVLAEGLAEAPGVVPTVLDPMGVFGGLEAAGARVVSGEVRAGAVPPRTWPALFDLDRAGAAGSLVYRAAAEADTLSGMRAHAASADAGAAARRAATTCFDDAAQWGVFDPDGLDVPEEPTVVDLAGVGRAGVSAVVAAVTAASYRRAADGEGPLPWLLVDEAHALDWSVAGAPLRRVLTRGRSPGVSLVLATQRPAALPDVAVSQSDLLVAHRLTGRDDLDALAAARPAYADGFPERLPEKRGVAAVVDEARESVHTVRVRDRRTPHGGDSPRASDRKG